MSIARDKRCSFESCFESYHFRYLCKSRSNYPEVFCKKGVPKIGKIHRKTSEVESV